MQGHCKVERCTTDDASDRAAGTRGCGCKQTSSDYEEAIHSPSVVYPKTEINASSNATRAMC
jgi:hypothetical protein